MNTQKESMLTVTSEMTGVTIEIANKDLQEKMSFQDAVRSCRQLGKGWRLPTMHELDLIHENLYSKGVGQIQSEKYWSGTKYRYDAMHVMRFWDFANPGSLTYFHEPEDVTHTSDALKHAIGTIPQQNESGLYRVRAVREVACRDLHEIVVYEKYRYQISWGFKIGTWAEAISMVKNYYGPEWDLPPTSYLEAMHKQLKGKSKGQLDGDNWSDSYYDEKTAWFVNLDTGKSDTEYISDFYEGYGSCRKSFVLVRMI